MIKFIDFIFFGAFIKVNFYFQNDKDFDLNVGFSKVRSFFSIWGILVGEETIGTGIGIGKGSAKGSDCCCQIAKIVIGMSIG